MDKLRIEGGHQLSGTIEISGAKNAALPLMAASLLTDEPIHFSAMPGLADVESMLKLLQLMGTANTNVAGAPGDVVLQTKQVLSSTAPYDYVRKMRASVLVLGPVLARVGEAKVSLPGGCAIGTRPIDIHLDGFERLGATISLEDGYVHATAPHGLTGAEIVMRQPSVGATENLMMAAALARGETRLVDCAREPEIVDLADLLRAMGCRIEGAGSNEIAIWGVDRLGGAQHRILPDRIEAGTYAMAAALTGGELYLKGAKPAHFAGAIEKLEQAGLSLVADAGGLHCKRVNSRIVGTDIMTRPYPGFATDLQAQFMAMMCQAEGASMITETIFENRFMHVPELLRMGANINIQGTSALVRGVEHLKGAPVMATDLRASVSLVLAGLAAKGETEVNRIYHLDRGYENLVQKLSSVGAVVERVP